MPRNVCKLFLCSMLMYTSNLSMNEYECHCPLYPLCAKPFNYLPIHHWLYWPPCHVHGCTSPAW
ncbi:hypothetical protein PM082_013829 [Marasmius tenuissimus]|nr:hypothetical protein PM082_013829 [Marasmius tenuissimus]